MSFTMKKIFGAKEKTPLGFCDAPQMTVSEFFFGENPNYPKYHTTYRPNGHIHRVAAEGDAARMEILITLGQCSVYDRDRKDRTALHFACVYGRLPVVTALVNNNCEIDALDKNHTTPLMKSVQCWKQKCASVLLEHGADPNISDSSGNSALHYAVYNGHEEMAALLLQYNADIEQKTKDGFTPLLLALREKRVEVAEYLVRMGADIHVVDDLQRNTLIYAIRCGSKDLAVLLLEKGVDFFYKDVFGWTALRYAIEGHCAFRQTLLDFEENLHSNKKDNEPELDVEPKTSCILAEQTDAGNNSLARVSRCPSPETPVLTMKEDENSHDTRQSNSESEPSNCAGNSPAAIDKIFGNRGKRTVEAWVEKDPSSKSATEVQEFVTNETVERIELLPGISETELELMSVEEDVSKESENDQPLSELEHLPRKKVGHLAGAGHQMGKIIINEQKKESDEEYAQLTTPIEMKDPVSKEPRKTKNVPTFKPEPDLEVTLKEDHNRFDNKRNTQTSRTRKDHHKTSGNVSVAADSRRERTNRKAAESAKDYPPLMPTNEMKDSIMDKVVPMKEAGIIQLEGPAVKLISEEEPNSQDGFERNPLPNICKQIPAQDAGYLSIAKYQRGERMMSQEKEFSKECPQSKPTIVKEVSASKESVDMIPVKSFLEDTPKNYPLSKPTVEKSDYVPNEVSDKKHGKWFQENCPKECAQLKLPTEEKDSFPREAPPVKQAKSYCADEPAFVKNSSRIKRSARQNDSSVKVTSAEDQKCLNDHEKNQRVAVSKRPQPKDIEYLSMANDESRENSAEGQEEASSEQQLQWKSTQPTTEEASSPNKVSATNPVKSFFAAEPTTNVSEGEREWCSSRNTQRQGAGNLFLTEDQRYDSSIQDEEEDFPEGYVQLKPLDKGKTPLPCEAPAKKEVKTFGTDENLSSEEEQELLDDSEEVENPHNVWLENISRDPQPKDIVHLPTTKDERRVNVTSRQEKGFPTEYPELKASIEKQDFVPIEDSALNQEKSFLAGPQTEHLRSEEEHTGCCDSDKTQRKNYRDGNGEEPEGKKIHRQAQSGIQLKAIFERLQLKRNARVSIDPPKIVKNTRTAEDRGATTVQLRPEEDQTGWYAIDKNQQKPIAERFQPRWNSPVSLNPEERGENMGVDEEKGATTVQLRPEEDQTGRVGSDKMPWKPLFERFQMKWSARVSVGPEKSRRRRRAGEYKVEPTIQVSSEEHSRCHGSVKKPRLLILERLQRKWSVRVCMETNQRGGKTKTAQMTDSSDEYPELKPTQTTIETQDSVPIEDPVMNPEISFMAEADLQVKSKEKKQTQAYENIQSVHVFKHLQPKGIGHLPMTVHQRSKAIASGEEGESDLNMASGDEQSRCHSSESSQSLVEGKMKNHESNGTDRTEYPYVAAVGGAAAAGVAGGSAATVGGVGGGSAAAAVGGGGGTAAAVGGGSAAAAVAAAAAGSSGAGVGVGDGGGAGDGGGTTSAIASATNELVLQRKSGEINNQRCLIKENAKHDRPRKKTSKEKHKVTKEVRAMGDVTQLSESISEDDSGFKKQDSLNSYNASIDLKKVNELLRKRNKKIENEKNAQKKEMSETREEKSKLEHEKVQGDEEFWNLRFTLRKELEESRDIHCIYEILKKHLNEKEKQHRERAAETQSAMRLRTRDLELKNTRDTLKELQEAQDQHIGAIKIAQKLKDDLQRVEYENSELKVKVKEQAKKIEKLSGYLQNSRERPERSSKPTQAGVRETLEALCKNISPVNQTGVRIQSLQSEPSQRKTVQDTNPNGLKSYEQQCIEELRISNAFLYERYNLYRNRRLEESRTKVQITVEQGTTPLNTSETKFALESPCVACTCPHRYFFPHEAVVLPGNPRSSNYCSQSYRRTMEDEEKSVKELTELKQSLECKLYHQKKKNDEIEKEIIGIKKFLKTTKIGRKIGECSSHGH